LFFFFIKETNWIRLIFGSLMMVSFVVLIIFLCFMLKSLVSHSEEE
jgi:Gpi18-like mannosyltransferase